MTCTACGHDNRAGAKFCEECATPLKRSCTNCGSELRPTAKFCDECGTAVQGSGPRVQGSGTTSAKQTTPLSDSRKVITIVFADLARSTALHERLDPESVTHFMESYYRAMRSAVEAHGGTVVKLLGDGVMAAFGVPQVAEDDAIRAVRAGVAMVQGVEGLAATGLGDNSSSPTPNPQPLNPLAIRVGINTGEVVVSADNTDVVGDPVNVAARLQQEANDGEVVIGEVTRRLVASSVTLAPLGSVALKGRAEAMPAYRVESLEPPQGAAAVAFVGRDEELRRITAVYGAAVAKRATQLAVLLGSPGLGKSRLIDEVARRLGDAATVLTAHCDAAGGATFEPVTEALRAWLARKPSDTVDTSDRSDMSDPSDERASVEALLRGTDAERTRIADGITALLAGSPASPEETFFVVRRFLSALAATKPVVLVIDDLQWAEPLLLDLVEHLVQWGSDLPLLVLVGARPELRDVRSSLATSGGLVADAMTLSGLDAGAAMRLAANVIGAADLPAAVAAKVLASSEGNPLFVAELVRMLVDEGVLTKEGERWAVGTDLAAFEMPPTIHALLAARIERLDPEERAVLERAAVVGRHFSRGAVAALLPGDSGDLDGRLEALRRTELIEPDSGWLLGEPGLRFHHVLIRDAAYRRLLKGTRAELHARLADWIESRAGDTFEHDETVGRHLEQAHQLLTELGPIDADGAALGERASRRLAAAARRSLARDDVPVAADLLGRAIERLDPKDPTRADLALDWCEALLAAGDVGPAAGAIEEIARFTRSDRGLGVRGLGVMRDDPAHLTPNPQLPNPRLQAWHTCFTGQLTVMTAPQELQVTADAVAQAADDFAELGDTAGEAKAHSVNAQALARLGKIGACEAALDKALAAARKAGDRRRANAVLAGAPLAALWGPSPVTRASGRCLDVVRVLRITQGAPAVEAVALSCQGVLEALRGRTDAARRMIASSRKMVEELGIAHRLFEADVFSGRIDLLEGDAYAAEHHLRGAYDGLRDLGLGIDAARAGAMLARALLARDEVEAAEALTHESEQLAGDDLQAAIAWRGARAEALARRGEHAAAVELAQAAVAIAAATDALLDHADARLALAAALRAAGRSHEADSEERRAIELWEAKGASLLAERARSEAKPSASRPDAGEAREGTEPMARRRLRPNANTAWSVRYEAAFAARDVETLIGFHSEDFREIDHPTGATYGHAGAATSLRKLLKAENPWFRQEALATLGDSLALGRRWYGAGGGGRLNVGPYEREEIGLSEVDAQGRVRYVEVFAPDRLSHGVIRLYEVYAESLPAGAERNRAAATARVMSLVLRETGRIDDLTAEVASGFESVDHRPLSTWSQKGGEAFLEHVRALHEVADEVVMPVTDVLALEPSAALIRRMHSGTERVGGGSYERPHLGLFVTGTDGRLERYEMFDVGHETEALARFEDLVGSGHALKKEKTLHRRVRPNAATRSVERFDAAIYDRDIDAVAATFSEELQVLYHPTGTAHGVAGNIATWRKYFRASRLAVRHTPVATLGARLALLHGAVSHAGIELKDGASAGPVEVDYFALQQVDEDERAIRSEVFAIDHLGDAIFRLYERHAELTPEGPERDRAVVVAQSVRAVGSAVGTPDEVEAVFAPDVESFDHRRLATWSASGKEAVVRQLRGLHQVASDVMLRDDEIVALDSSAVLTRRVNVGTTRLGGGVYERSFLSLFAFGPDGRITHVEMFETDHEAEALARFDELVGSEAARNAVEPFANAASRIPEQIARAWATGDWETFKAVHDALHSPTHHYDDRRPLMRLKTSVETSLESLRLMFDVPGSRWIPTTVATRGERLALTRVTFEGSVDAGGGDLAIDYLALGEIDEQGRCETESVIFDPDDLDAAFAELDRRWMAGEAQEHPTASRFLSEFQRCFAERDWDTAESLFAPDLVSKNHRLTGFGTLHGASALRSNWQAQFELAPDTRARIDHTRIGERCVMSQVTWHGTRDGGRFELTWVAVSELNADGQAQRLDIWDEHRSNEAAARFEEIEKGGRPDSFPAQLPKTSWIETVAKANAGRATIERWVRTYEIASETGDWNPMRELCAPDVVFEDRRRLFFVSGGLDLLIAAARERVTIGARFDIQLAGSAGERVSILRSRLSGGPADGQWEIEYLSVVELDDNARIAALLMFDLDDGRAARREAWRRWALIEPEVAHMMTSIAELEDACNAQDWPRLRAHYADDLVVVDHRRTGMGRLEGADAYIDSLVALWQLSASTRLELGWFSLAIGPHGGLFTVRRTGNVKDGGSFESEYLALALRTPTSRLEMFELEDLDKAMARFEELSDGPNPLAPFPARERGIGSSLPAAGRDRGRGSLAAIVKPNLAGAMLERWREAFNARDWAACRALMRPELRWEDRRRLFQTTGDAELVLASTRERAEAGAYVDCHIIGTAGDRVAVGRLLYFGGPTDGRFEIELLMIVVTDESGLSVATVQFDPDETRAAQREAWARWAAIEPRAVQVTTPIGEQIDAFNTHDSVKYRAVFADDLTVDDHRRTGMGRITGADAYVESLIALWELAPESRVDAGWFWPAIGDHGAITNVRRTGTVPGGGGEFESDYLHLCTVADDLVTRIELFDVVDLDAALARFAELGRSSSLENPAATSIPPTAATRVRGRIRDAFQARDWTAIRNLARADFRYEDRAKRALLSGDIEMWLGTMQYWRPEACIENTLLATVGDRVAIDHLLFTGRPDGDPFEVDCIRVVEVDEEERLRTTITFDVDDRGAAFEEAHARFVEGEAAPVGGQAPIATLLRALELDDWEAVRNALSADLIHDDHRTLGLDSLSRDEWIDSLRALQDLSEGTRTEPFHTLAWNRHGRVAIMRQFGGVIGGGPFENVFVVLWLTDAERVCRIEVFDVSEAERAVAHFEELCAARADAEDQ